MREGGESGGKNDMCDFSIIKKKPVINVNWTRRPSPSRLCPAECDCVALCPDTPRLLSIDAAESDQKQKDGPR